MHHSSLIAGSPSETSQVNALKFQLADMLELEEEWSEAARVLMSTSLESGQRYRSALPSS